jgi:phospholipid N-methyltransferase
MFIAKFIRDPASVGAIAPSSQQLAAAMVGRIDFTRVRTIVELGPGTGVFSAAVLAGIRQAGSRTRFLAVERDREFAASLAARLGAGHVAQGDATDLARLCATHGIADVDYVVSGLPWAAFAPELQDTLMAQVRAVLAPEGGFATFAYLQGLMLRAGQRFRGQLRGWFTHVEESPTVWWNLPPAFVYYCRSPRVETPHQA